MKKFVVNHLISVKNLVKSQMLKWEKQKVGGWGNWGNITAKLLSFRQVVNAAVLLLFSLFLTNLSVSFATETPLGWFSFPIHWNDTTSGTATDISFLNEKPAGKNGRIIVKRDKFIESETGKTIRFIGINMGGDVAFPKKEDGEKFAAHLAKAGVNVIRFHNLDGENPVKTLIDTKQPDTQHFNEEHLDRFFYFISECKKNGIYSNINLRVMRSLVPGDGVPEWKNQPYPLKKINRFSPRWIELQKKWAKDLLTRKNPYTGMTLAEDPAVLVVELDNENSILENGTEFYTQIPEFYQEELRVLWNQWLKNRYKTDDMLAAAWKPASLSMETLLNKNSEWNLERHGTEIKLIRSNISGVMPDIEVEVGKGGSQDWHVQVQLLGLTLENGEDYTLSFKIRSSVPNNSRLGVQWQIDNWRSNGLTAYYKTDNQWHNYTFSFIARDTIKDKTRIAFFVGGKSNNKIEIADVKMVKGNPNAGLQPEESLETQNIPLPQSGGKLRLHDLLQFMVDLDKAFAQTMRDYLKNEIKVQSLIIDSQIDYGGVSGMNRESDMDFVDAHAYWEHPDFIGVPWDFSMGNWRIGNSSQLRAMARTKHTCLQLLGERRIDGKPFSVSEYDCPFPSDFATEMMPFLTVIASLQDWDALYTFCAGPYGSYGSSDVISGSFDNTNHPGKFGFFPAAALAYRTGAFSPLPNIITLKLPQKPWNSFFRIQPVWEQTLGRYPDILNERSTVSPIYLDETTSPQIQLTTDSKKTQPSVTVRNIFGLSFLLGNSPTCVVLSGPFGGGSIGVGPLNLNFDEFEGNFGAVMLNSLDGIEIENSERILLTIGGRFENSKMVWNVERNCTGINPGEPPVIGTSLHGRIEIKTSGTRKVYALDATGTRKHNIVSEWKEGILSFFILPEYQTLYYEIVR
ncbi:MAG: carbohydrate binding domain-containing protein [Planctomycetaceae bacterium]|nr:carbohydrate binding domain-containing protein [Planctomycetaceae bacterium]